MASASPFGHFREYMLIICVREYRILNRGLMVNDHLIAHESIHQMTHPLDLRPAHEWSRNHVPAPSASQDLPVAVASRALRIGMVVSRRPLSNSHANQELPESTSSIAQPCHLS